MNKFKIAGGSIAFSVLAFIFGTFIVPDTVVWTADSVVEVRGNYVTELGTEVSGVPMELECKGCGTATNVSIEGNDTSFTTEGNDTVSFHIPALAVGSYFVEVKIPRKAVVRSEFHVQGCDICILANGCPR